MIRALKNALRNVTLHAQALGGAARERAERDLNRTFRPRVRDWLHGRVWIRERAFTQDETVVTVEWNLLHGRNRGGAYMEHGDVMGADSERHVSAWLGLPWLSHVYASFEGRRIPALPAGRHEIGWHGGKLWIKLLDRGDGSWRALDPWWRRLTLDPLDLIGPLHHTSTSRRVADVLIPMPEGNYTAVLHEEQVTARRWHFAKRWTVWSLDEIRPAGPMRCVCYGPTANPTPSLTERGDCERCGGTGWGYLKQREGIPIPGKGTESWNCGEDAFYGVSYSDLRNVKTPQDVVGRCVTGVLTTRLRRGGWEWWPSIRSPAAEGSDP